MIKICAVYLNIHREEPDDSLDLHNCSIVNAAIENETNIKFKAFKTIVCVCRTIERNYRPKMQILKLKIVACYLNLFHLKPEDASALLVCFFFARYSNVGGIVCTDKSSIIAAKLYIPSPHSNEKKIAYQFGGISKYQRSFTLSHAQWNGASECDSFIRFAISM